MTPKLFSELGLSPEVLKAIDKLGFEQAAPIQAEAIPVLLAGKDVVGQSQTGSGKTAAFVIPALERVDVNSKATQVLILCPTRELAVQVAEEVHKLALFKRGFYALPIYGGQSYDRQLYGLRQGAQVVIGTPGRVMDHMRRGTLRLDALKMVILDEVDVMLNMGFRDDIELILQSTPATRQTVFFSATIPPAIRQLMEKYAKDATQIKIEQKAMTVPTVEQVYYEVDRRSKIELLTRLIDLHDLKLGIIFCNTKRMVDELADHLNAQGYSADRLHGDLSQAMRDRVMNKFRKSGLEFLVATDVAARGIDVDDVEVVFNYDLPYDSEDYVHRIGRTGRRGRAGRAISFVSGRELFQIRVIERYTNTRVHRGKPPTASEVAEVRANVFIDKLRATLQGGEFPRQDQLLARLLEEGFDSTDVFSALMHHVQTGEAPKPAPPREEEPRRDDRERDRGPRRDFSDDRRERSPRYDDRPPRREMSAPRTLPPRTIAPAVAPKVEPAAAPKAPVATKPIASEKPAMIPASVAPLLPSSVKAPVVAAKPAPVVVKTPVVVKAGAPVANKVVQAPVINKPLPAPAAKTATAPASDIKPTKPAAAILAKTVRTLPADSVSPVSAPKPKASRATPETHTRLWMNVGEQMGVTQKDIIDSVSGHTGLPAKTVGTVDVRERHSFVDVAGEHANSIIAKLNRSEIKGHKVRVKVA